ncbi:hypothetical protein QJS04_geneDACA020171 [Acorus gramineus]|uniref:Uncharacterized protein n=1 Tax=Acorus gramineus TaxID=55184 RepID=A0AAV9BSX4_ACOGR|nr:hypothetical protein QJS04_geneDACA020171 [Acorus gramineus]
MSTKEVPATTPGGEERPHLKEWACREESIGEDDDEGDVAGRDSGGIASTS